MEPMLQQTFFLTISTGLSAGGGFVAWSVAAHVAPPHAVGVATGLLAICSLLSYLSSLALPYGLLRYGHLARTPRMIRHALLLTTVTSILAAVIFALGSPWWSPDLAPSLNRADTMAIFTILNVAVGVAVLVDAYLVARRRAGLACARNGLVAIGKIGALALLVTITGTSRATLIYLAMLTPVAVSALCFALPLVRASPDNPLPDERGLSAEFFKFSLRNYPGALLDGAPVFLLPVLVLRLVGATDYAYFFVAWSVSGVIGLLAAAVGQVALRESAARDDQRVLAVRARLLVLAVTGSAVLILLPAAGLVLHIFGSSYASFSVLPLRLLVLSAIPGAHLTITIALLRGRKRYSAVNQSSVAYAALSIGASVGLGAIAGVPGVCAGWLIGVSLSAAVATLVAARRPSDAVISESDRSIILEDSRDARTA